MEQDKELQSLFGQFAKDVPGLMSIEEVEQTISAIPPVKTPQGIDKLKINTRSIKSFKKIKIAMTTISAITISTVLLLNVGSEKQPVNKARVSNQPMVIENAITPSIGPVSVNENSLRVTEPAEKRGSDHYITYDTSKKTRVDKQVEIIEDVREVVEEIEIVSSGLPAGNKITTANAPYLRLNDEELFKLGIVGKDGGIFYEETFNKEKPFKFNYVVKGNGYSTTVSGGTKDMILHPGKYPYIITDKQVSSVWSVGNWKELKDTIELARNYNKYLPVIVSNGINNEHAVHANELIFWFPKNDYFIALMPERVQKALAVDPLSLSWDLRTGREYRKRVEGEIETVAEDVETRNNGKLDVLAGKTIMIPDEALLNKLGFEKDKDGKLKINLEYKKFYFKIFTKDMGTYFLYDCPSKEYFEEVKAKYKLPVPLFVSDSLCEMNNVTALSREGDDDGTNGLQELLNMQYKLVPLRVHVAGELKYFWYENSPKFNACLDAGQKALVATIVKEREKRQMVVKKVEISTQHSDEPGLKEIYEFRKEVYMKVNTVDVNNKETEKLGYKVEGNDLRIFINSSDTARQKGHYKTTVLTHTKQGTKIDEKEERFYMDRILPVYISDDLGKHTYMSIIEDSSYGPFNFEDLIPVLVKTGRSYTLTDMVNKVARPDYILWYKATPEFLSLLPTDVKTEIQNEIKNAPADSGIIIPCKYTDVCRQHKESIMDASVYPNPAKDLLNVRVEFKAITPITISLTDLGGKMITQRMVKPNALTSETSIDVNGLESGIYYLYIQTEQGDMIVRKVLVSH